MFLLPIDVCPLDDLSDRDEGATLVVPLASLPGMFLEVFTDNAPVEVSRFIVANAESIARAFVALAQCK